MKKHVLFIVENNAVPHDIRVWREAHVAKDMGLDVTVICREAEGATKRYEKISGIEIYRHPIPNGTLGELSFVIEYFVALLWELFLSLKIYIRKPFQIIHSANPPDDIFLIAMFYKPFGVKYIFDHHDLAPELYRTRFSGEILYRILILFEKLSCKFADMIITTNQSYKQIVIDRHHIDPSKILVVRNDPSIKWYGFEGQNYKKEVNYKKVLLYVGSINIQDGVNILICALYHLVNDLNEKNFICQIIGDGDALESVKQISKVLKLEQYLDFKGFIYEKEKVVEYISLSDICIEPAPDNELNRYSTFIKIMEYMAAGKPIVAFDLVETRFSADGSAILVKPGDMIGFGKGIKKLMNEPELREKLGREGRERIEKELNWEKSSFNLIQAYKSIMNSFSLYHPEK